MPASYTDWKKCYFSDNTDGPEDDVVCSIVIHDLKYCDRHDVKLHVKSLKAFTYIFWE